MLTRSVWRWGGGGEVGLDINKSSLVIINCRQQWPKPGQETQQRTHSKYRHTHGNVERATGYILHPFDKLRTYRMSGEEICPSGGRAGIQFEPPPAAVIIFIDFYYVLNIYVYFCIFIITTRCTGADSRSDCPCARHIVLNTFLVLIQWYNLAGQIY